MKKSIISLIMLCSSVAIFAQVDVGFMVSPNLSLNRINETSADLSLKNNKSGVRYSLGPEFDFFIKDHVAFNTGLFYTVKRSGLSATLDSNGLNTSPLVNIQYLQIPVGFKFYTNNISEKMKIYFQLGTLLNGKIAEKFKNEPDAILFKGKSYANFFDAEASLGAGIELGIGSSNKLYAGLKYNRGLLNVASKDVSSVINTDLSTLKLTADDLKIKNDLFSLVVGFKF